MPRTRSRMLLSCCGLAVAIYVYPDEDDNTSFLQLSTQSHRYSWPTPPHGRQAAVAEQLFTEDLLAQIQQANTLINKKNEAIRGQIMKFSPHGVPVDASLAAAPIGAGVGASRTATASAVPTAPQVQDALSQHERASDATALSRVVSDLASSVGSWLRGLASAASGLASRGWRGLAGQEVTTELHVASATAMVTGITAAPRMASAIAETAAESSAGANRGALAEGADNDNEDAPSTKKLVAPPRISKADIDLLQQGAALETGGPARAGLLGTWALSQCVLVGLLVVAACFIACMNQRPYLVGQGYTASLAEKHKCYIPAYVEPPRFKPKTGEPLAQTLIACLHGSANRT